ncbi:MAG: glycosyltransferase family 9 protein [Oligoflexia bacterium]|nr:glycosyltransferase family 9 protein [Oligoflexia bacterium]
MKKILIVRFSSFGDIVQAMGVVPCLGQTFPDAAIDWVVRSDFAEVVRLEGRIRRVWSFERHAGFMGLVNIARLAQLAREIHAEQYDLIYDAHSNLRSTILKLLLRGLSIFGPLRALSAKKTTTIITRSKERWKRLLLFYFRINHFDKPFCGAKSYLQPLFPMFPVFNFMHAHWDFPQHFEQSNDANIVNIVLVPSAAWPMKRWPLEHFHQLLKILGESLAAAAAAAATACRPSGYRFVIIGGPEDSFCEELVLRYNQHARDAQDAQAAQLGDWPAISNLAGKLTLLESCYVVATSCLVVSADTGFLHVADLLGKPGVALIGPTAFGFPSGKSLKVMEADESAQLKCRPCTKDGRGKCSHQIYQFCMVAITPERVAEQLLSVLDLERKELAG